MSWATAVAQPSELGESPFWHPDEQLLYWVDIAGKKIHRSNVFMGTVESWAMAAPHELEPGCIAPAGSGGLVVALRDGIYRARTWGGALEKLADAAHDPRTTRFNDGKCDPLGRFWAGTIYEPRDAREAAEIILRFYAVYHSLRYVDDQLVLRIRRRLPSRAVSQLNREFRDLLADGVFRQGGALSEEADEPELRHLPRLIFPFNRRDYGRLLALIRLINRARG